MQKDKAFLSKWLFGDVTTDVISCITPNKSLSIPFYIIADLNIFAEKLQNQR